MKDSAARATITRIKQQMGDRLVILGHHYQSDEVLEFADYVGDSLELAKKAATIDKADTLVFCGVYFMAETAAVLAPDKSVYIPDLHAGCPLADMAKADDVARAWERIRSISSSVTPVTYVNSSVEIKAFCGRNNGIVCTSGNAGKVFTWAFEQSHKVFFMPDRNLGRNTAHAMHIPDHEIVEWDPEKPQGGLADEELEKARVILWKGWCPVHWPGFTRENVQDLRRQYPGIKVIVHPESDPDTVRASDVSGSTARIIEYVQGLKHGDTVAIGTEYNLVARVAKRYQPLMEVMPLSRQLCDDMAKITLDKLALTLTSLEGDTFRVVVEEDIARDALKALTNMLGIQP